MATFGKTSFNTTVYAASRPTYPQALYDFIFDLHKQSPDAKFERAVDLGCGTGKRRRSKHTIKRTLTWRMDAGRSQRLAQVRPPSR